MPLVATIVCHADPSVAHRAGAVGVAKPIENPSAALGADPREPLDAGANDSRAGLVDVSRKRSIEAVY